jgi:hypothetical protein
MIGESIIPNSIQNGKAGNAGGFVNFLRGKETEKIKIFTSCSNIRRAWLIY